MEISARTPIVEFMEIWPPFASLSDEKRETFAEYGRALASNDFDCPVAVVSWDNLTEFREQMLQVAVPNMPDGDAETLFVAFWQCVNSDMHPDVAIWHWTGFRDFPSSMTGGDVMRRLQP